MENVMFTGMNLFFFRIHLFIIEYSLMPNIRGGGGDGLLEMNIRRGDKTFNIGW